MLSHLIIGDIAYQKTRFVRDCKYLMFKHIVRDFRGLVRGQAILVQDFRGLVRPRTRFSRADTRAEASRTSISRTFNSVIFAVFSSRTRLLFERC